MEENSKITNWQETKFIELKREYTSSILKTVTAYANYHDGKILIGISDDGDVVGVTNVSQLRVNIENSINDNISPKPYFEMSVKDYSNKPVLELKVFKGEFIPYYYKNKAYKRSDTSSVEVDRLELNKLILQGQNFSFEELESKNQILEFNYMEKLFREKKKINKISLDIMKSLELVKNEKYTNSAALLSDANPLENSSVILIKYSKDLLNIKDKVILNKMSIIKQFDECINFYHKHISIQEIIRGPYRETIEEIPIVAYREAVANAIIHRDYMAKVDTKVEFFDDRIEIISPGGLPSGISEEEFIEGRLSVLRNRIIADIFLRLGIIEKLATGIRRIKEYYKGSISVPKFDVKENSIKVVLPKIYINPEEPALYIDYNKLNNDETTLMNYLEDNGEVTRKVAEELIKKGKTHTYKVLKSLIEKNYITTIGKGKNLKYIH